MVLPTGTISLSQVNVELGFPATSTISLNDPLVRCLAGPTFLTPGTQISMNDLRGKANRLTATGGTRIVSPDGYTYHIFNSPGSLVITGKCTGSVNIQSWLVGGGGGGGGNPTGLGAAGGGGGGAVSPLTLPVGPGTRTWTIRIGAGGAGGSSPSSGQPGFGPNITGSNTSIATPTLYTTGAGAGGNLENGLNATPQLIGRGGGGGGGAAGGGANYIGGSGSQPGGGGGGGTGTPRPVFGGGGGSNAGAGRPGPLGGAGGGTTPTGWPGIPAKGAGGTGATPTRSGGNAAANSGSGGGGGSLGRNGGNGGSGSVIIRYLTAN